MDVLLWAFLLIFTSAGSAELKKDFVNVAEVYGNTTQLILEQNGAMRKCVTDETQKMFATMSKSFDRKLATFGAELNVSLQKLSASLNRNLRRLDSEMGTSHRNLSQVFTRKLSTTQSNVEVSLEGLSKALGEELRRSQSKVTLLWNRQELCHSPSDLAASLNSTPLANGPKNQSKVVVRSDVISSQPPVQTEVEEISAEEGTIEFVGGANLKLRRKIWVLRSKGLF